MRRREVGQCSCIATSWWDLCGPRSHEEPLDKTDSNQTLMANAYVYITADYYQIPELMDLALAKFCKASMYFYQPGFTDVVALVYDSALSRARELRSVFCSIVVRNATSLVTDGTFIDVGVRLPGFMKEILPKLVTEYECRLTEERDGMMKSTSDSPSLALRLETTKAKVAEAEARLRAAEEETAHTRRKVNESKCCRHCGKENNVFFEYDYRAYSLRCVCRTRY